MGIYAAYLDFCNECRIHVNCGRYVGHSAKTHHYDLARVLIHLLHDKFSRSVRRFSVIFPRLFDHLTKQLDLVQLFDEPRVPRLFLLCLHIPAPSKPVCQIGRCVPNGIPSPAMTSKSGPKIFLCALGPCLNPSIILSVTFARRYV